MTTKMETSKIKKTRQGKPRSRRTSNAKQQNHLETGKKDQRWKLGKKVNNEEHNSARE